MAYFERISNEITNTMENGNDSMSMGKVRVGFVQNYDEIDPNSNEMRIRSYTTTCDI